MFTHRSLIQHTPAGFTAQLCPRCLVTLGKSPGLSLPSSPHP